MTQQAQFEQWNDLTKKVQEPFKAIADLNIKTLQGLNFLKAEDLTSLKNPEEMWEKQMNLAIENGHKALDYMQESFKIIEKAMLKLSSEIKDKV